MKESRQRQKNAAPPVLAVPARTRLLLRKLPPLKRKRLPPKSNISPLS